jgi:hypothetical protein
MPGEPHAGQGAEQSAHVLCNCPDAVQPYNVGVHPSKRAQKWQYKHVGKCPVQL